MVPSFFVSSLTFDLFDFFRGNKDSFMWESLEASDSVDFPESAVLVESGSLRLGTGPGWGGSRRGDCESSFCKGTCLRRGDFGGFPPSRGVIGFKYLGGICF